MVGRKLARNPNFMIEERWDSFQKTKTPEGCLFMNRVKILHIMGKGRAL